MTSLLTWLIGRLPIGWLQLQHNRTRLLSAVGGVTFANVLIFMQLGFMGALFESSVKAHRSWNADIVIASSDFRSIRELNPLPRARMFQALSVPGVASAECLYVAPKTWTDPATGDTTTFRVTGVRPEAQAFVDERIQSQLHRLTEADVALVDEGARQFNPTIAQDIASQGKHRVEIAGHTIDLRGMFHQGASFDADGALIVSDLTFFRLLPQFNPGTPSFILVKCESGANVEQVTEEINKSFSEDDARAFTLQGIVLAEQAYQRKQTPVGFVFSFGIVIGIIVGMVMVYQVLTTDVQDHLPEYATIKAIGYSSWYFLSIVFEEALSLAILGFIPGLAISLVLYEVAAQATALPITMPLTRPLMVSGFTLLMCTISGALATRRLAHADPADLF